MVQPSPAKNAQPPLRSSWYGPAALLLLLVLAIVVSLIQFRPPAPQPADAPATEFSALRAVDLLANFATRPHPTGSPAAAETRDFLLAQLAAFGFETEIQATTGVLEAYGVAGRVENVVGRLPGRDNSGGLLLVAHYDSVPAGPGAGDNGSGVVTILETLRAMRDELPLRNDLLVLFTDAEEVGTLGAQAFVAEHRWMDDVALALNIEGAMNGPVVLIETGRQNGRFLHQYRAAVARPVAFSWVYDLYLMLPYLTDFSPFKEAGLAGGNLFAYNGGPEYHTPCDNLANVSLDSLQHHGDQLLALTRHLGASDLAETHAPDVVYFNLLASWLIIYPNGLVIPLALLAALLFLLVLRQGLRCKLLSWGGMGRELLFWLAGLILATVAVMLVWQLVCLLHPTYGVYFPSGHFYNDVSYFVVALALSFAVLALLAWLRRDKGCWSERAFGVLWLVLLLTLLSAVFLPGFSYLFTWPLLVVLALLAYRFGRREETPGRFDLPLAMLALLVTSLLWLPLLSILYAGTALSFLIVIPFVIALFFGLAIAPLTPLLALRRPLLATLALAVTLVALVGGSLTANYSADQPRPSRVRYVLNSDTGWANWVNAAHDLSDWEQQFLAPDAATVSFSEIFPPWSSTIRASAAPAADWPAPLVEVLEKEHKVRILDEEEEQKDEWTTLRLHVSSPRGADRLILALVPGTGVRALQIDGRPVLSAEALAAHELQTWLTTQFISLPPEGVEVTIEVDRSLLIEFIVADWSAGLPDLPEMRLAPRPDDLISLGDESLVFARYGVRLAP